MHLNRVLKTKVRILLIQLVTRLVGRALRCSPCLVHDRLGLEAGQAIVANVSVAWDDENMRAELLVHELTEGEKTSPMNLLWSDGAIDWGYDKNKIVRINGLAVEDNGTWFLSEPGSDKRILLDTVNNCIGLDEIHVGTAMTWEGRLLQVEDSDSLTMVYSLSSADVDDNDNDGLSDALESAFGTSSNNEDTDGDGVSDRQRIHRPIVGDEMIEAYFYELWWLLGALFFGVMLGSLTGLIPGFPRQQCRIDSSCISPGLLELGIPLSAVAAIIVSTGTVHTF